MKFLFDKIHQRFKEFQQHPLTKKRTLSTLYRYFLFHISILYFKERKYKWIDGLHFLARKGDAGLVANIFYGLYEFNESGFLLHFLREDDIFLDVGANLGHYSLLASGIKKCQSIAIEPVPQTFDQLNKQVKLNNLQDKINTINIGLSSSQSELYFSTDRGTMNCVVTRDYPGAEKIPVQTLDAVSKGFPINLLKIDVEGFEKMVLLGSEELLKSSNLKAIIIEINFNNRNYNTDNSEIVKILKEKNFFPFRYNPLNRELTSLSNYNEEQFNTIFIKDEDYVYSRIKKSRKIHVRNNYI